MVNIKIRLKPRYGLEEGRYLVSIPIVEGMKVVKGKTSFGETVKANQVAEWEIIVKFTKAKCYDVNIQYRKDSYFRVSFYVGGGYRESLDNRSFGLDIKDYKKYLDEMVIDTSDFLRLGIRGLDHHELKKQQTLVIETGYDELNKEKANNWNKKHYFDLKKEYNELMGIHIKKYKRPASSSFYGMIKENAKLIDKKTIKVDASSGKLIDWTENVPTGLSPIDTTLENLPVDSLHDGRLINYIIPYK